jgi:oligoendopeptidase F
MDRFWSMIPHFFQWPGYVYAYAYGNLLSLALFARYRQVGPGFVPGYVEFLSAGGSRPPAELGAIAGVDLGDPSFWAAGLDLIEEQIRAVEALAPGAG